MSVFVTTRFCFFVFAVPSIVYNERAKRRIIEVVTLRKEKKEEEGKSKVSKLQVTASKDKRGVRALIRDI